jgi:hypothetical protein
MDSDDIASPDRLFRQISHLEAHSEVSVLGGAIKMFKSGTTLVKSVQYPTTIGSVHFGMFYNCIMIHPTILFRATLFQTPNIPIRYDDNFRYAEDYALWLHLIERGNVRLDNLPNPPILRLRKHTENESKIHGDRQRAASRLALKTVLDRLIQMYAPEPWSVTQETVNSILTGYDHQTLQTIQESFKVTEIIEQHLLSQSIFSESDRANINLESVKQMGALATMEMRLSTQTPSALYCWTRWLSRRPTSDLGNLLGLAQVSATLNAAKKSTYGDDKSSAPTAEDFSAMHTQEATATATINATLPSSSSSSPVPRVTVICFSKDRAFQMQEYLHTLDEYVIKSSPTVKFDVHVIWRTSTEKFRNSYLLLSASRFNHFHWIEETNFTQHLSEIVKDSAPYILWGVDDVLYYNPTDIRPFVDLMRQDPEILCSTLRLSPNVTYCHPSNAHSKLPNFTSVTTFECSATDVKDFRQEILKFDRSQATEDWNYPFELCATMMHKNMVSDILLAITNVNGLDGLSHPNKLEVSGSRLFTKQLLEHARLTSCLCVKHPVLSVITVNRVQDVCENRIYTEISLDALEKHFDDKRKMDLAYYRSKLFDAVHIGDFVLSP